MEPSFIEIDKKLTALVAESDLSEKLNGANATLLDSVKLNYVLGAAASHVLQGSALWELSKFPEAIKSFDKAKIQLAQLPSCYWHVLLHFGYGNVYRELGVLDQALENFLTALKIAREIQDETLMIKAEGNVGSVAIARGDYTEGIETFLNVVNLAKGAAHHQIRVTGYINLAAAYHYLGEYQNAIKAAQNALALASTVIDRIGAHGNLGVAYTGIEDYEKAKFHLEKSLEIAHESPLTLSQCVCSIDLADYHIKLGEDDKAIQLLLDALKLALTIDFKSGIRDCHQRLHLLFRKQNKWEVALLHHEQLYLITQSIFSESSDARLRDLEALYRVEELRNVNERQRHEFEALNQVRDALLSDFSHDLKNPLATLSLGMFVFKDKISKLPAEYHGEFNEFCGQLELQVERMISLIKDVLDMASYESKAEPELQQLNITTLLNEVCNEFRAQSTTKNISLHCQSPNQIYLLAEGNALRRMLGNLVSNAIKYTRAGGRVEVEADRLGERHIVIRIKDNGIGIPKDQLPRIFERFYRVPDHKNIAEGTGLGMAIVKSIVDKHKGDIKIESAVNAGTTIIITLPTL